MSDKPIYNGEVPLQPVLNGGVGLPGIGQPGTVARDFALKFPYVDMAKYSPDTVTQTAKAAEILGEYAALFARKQEAYGIGNIDGFGELGVLVRVNDKLERLKNLIYKNRTTDLESVEDTWLDILGYGLIGLMVHRGKWRQE